MIFERSQIRCKTTRGIGTAKITRVASVIPLQCVKIQKMNRKYKNREMVACN